ncbi:MAG: class A beta-lactamase-related serine hydrolase, partial [Verrucomicrobiaceae bacterium]
MNLPAITTVRRLWGSRSRSFLFPALMLTLMRGVGHSQNPASFPPATPAAPAALPADFDAQMERVLRTFAVPGMAVAIVKDGVPVLTKGYGARRMGDSLPVDQNTLFCIASNSKAFTGAALGMLVEEGKLEWDAPVIRYLPWFQMSDPWVTREITVRDLLVHRSGLGLGAGDLLIWPPSGHSRKEVVRRLRHVPTVTSFRSRYAYDNVLYLVAGEVVEAVSGQSWEEFVTTRILKRLGMDSSLSSLVGAEHAPALAAPHAVIEGKLKPVDYFSADSINPAGGITSSAADMSRWLRTLLAGGKIPDRGEERLFTEKTGRELMTPVTPMPIDDPAPELAGLRMNFCGYALGFSVRDYRGCRLVTHTGGLPGYASRVMLIPERGLGMAVLTNQESGEAFNAV